MVERPGRCRGCWPLTDIWTSIWSPFPAAGVDATVLPLIRDGAGGVRKAPTAPSRGSVFRRATRRLTLGYASSDVTDLRRPGKPCSTSAPSSPEVEASAAAVTSPQGACRPISKPARGECRRMDSRSDSAPSVDWNNELVRVDPVGTEGVRHRGGNRARRAGPARPNDAVGTAVLAYYRQVLPRPLERARLGHARRPASLRGGIGSDQRSAQLLRQRPLHGVAGGSSRVVAHPTQSLKTDSVGSRVLAIDVGSSPFSRRWPDRERVLRRTCTSMQRFAIRWRVWLSRRLPRRLARWLRILFLQDLAAKPIDNPRSTHTAGHRHRHCRLSERETQYARHTVRRPHPALRSGRVESLSVASFGVILWHLSGPSDGFSIVTVPKSVVLDCDHLRAPRDRSSRFMVGRTADSD